MPEGAVEKGRDCFQVSIPFSFHFPIVSSFERIGGSSGCVGVNFGAYLTSGFSLLLPRNAAHPHVKLPGFARRVRKNLPEGSQWTRNKFGFVEVNVTSNSDSNSRYENILITPFRVASPTLHVHNIYPQAHI